MSERGQSEGGDPTPWLGWLRRVRPMALGELLSRLVIDPCARRRIVRTRSGADLYVDPLTHLGAEVLATGEYEPFIASELLGLLRPGTTFVDVGANEGAFCGLAARRVGPSGFVVAVEPQMRLQALIRINVALNQGLERLLVVSGAWGGPDGAQGRLNLWPSLNSGASGLVYSYRFGWRKESVVFLDPARALSDDRVTDDLVLKIDVEGYEVHVLRALGPLLRRFRAVLVDFHEAPMRALGVSATEARALLSGAGLTERSWSGTGGGYARFDRA